MILELGKQSVRKDRNTVHNPNENDNKGNLSIGNHPGWKPNLSKGYKNVPRLYMNSKDGGRGLISVFDCIKQDHGGTRFVGIRQGNKRIDTYVLKVVH